MRQSGLRLNVTSDLGYKDVALEHPFNEDLQYARDIDTALSLLHAQQGRYLQQAIQQAITPQLICDTNNSVEPSSWDQSPTSTESSNAYYTPTSTLSNEGDLYQKGLLWAITISSRDLTNWPCSEQKTQPADQQYTKAKHRTTAPSI